MAHRFFFLIHQISRDTLRQQSEKQPLKEICLNFVAEIFNSILLIHYWDKVIPTIYADAFILGVKHSRRILFFWSTPCWHLPACQDYGEGWLWPYQFFSHFCSPVPIDFSPLNSCIHLSNETCMQCNPSVMSLSVLADTVWYCTALKFSITYLITYSTLMH